MTKTKKKLLFIGPYRQSDELGEISRSHLLSLMKVDCDITIQPIYQSQNILEDIGRELQKLEDARYSEYDVCIQNVSHGLLYYDGRFKKNIGLVQCDAKTILDTRQLNLMDQLVVPSNQDRWLLLRSGVTIPITVIPIASWTEKYEKSYAELPLTYANKNAFIFYFVGEYVHQSNISALVYAFHTEFHPSENVELLLNISRPGMPPNELTEVASKELAILKNNLHLYKNTLDYKQEILYTQPLNIEKTCELHTKCHCFVMPTYYASCSPAIIDALGFGKTPIITGDTGLEEYVGSDSGYVVKSHETPAVSSDMHTARQTWQQIDLLDLRRAMRDAFEHRDNNSSRIAAGMDTVYDLAYTNMIKRWEQIIE